MGSCQSGGKNGILLKVFRNLQQLFACRIVVLRLLRLNIKARHEISEFLNANLWSICLIAFNIDWSWNIFTSHNFCSLLIEQLIDLEKVKTENLKIRTDLWDLVMDGWSVTQQMIVYKDKLLKKSSIWKSKLILSTLVTTLHFICDLSGCKLWLLSIQNHARHRFQAFARHHLKLLCCSIWIWADALSWDRSHFICDLLGCKLWLLSIQNHTRHHFQAFVCRHLKSLCCSI